MSPTRLALVACKDTIARCLTGSTNLRSISQLCNLTVLQDGTERIENASGSPRDDEGAMKFVIAVLLVYSLIGTVGTMVLRFRQSATKRCKNEALEDVEHYLKYRDQMSYDCQKARLLKETKRVLTEIQTREDHWNCTQINDPGFSPDVGKGKHTSSRLVSESPSTIGSSTHLSHEQRHLLDLNLEVNKDNISLIGETQNLKQGLPTGAATPTKIIVDQSYRPLLLNDAPQQSPSELGSQFTNGQFSRFYLVPADALLTNLAFSPALSDRSLPPETHTSSAMPVFPEL